MPACAWSQRRAKESVIRRITFSPKVFVPLTMLCRDRCGYCTFAQSPSHLPAPYLTEEQVLAIAREGARAGCHEALLTLGEAPEERYPVARAWLDEHGFASTVAYVAHVARLILDETGLLPHANAGALSAADLATLRKVSPSQGMMIETLNPSIAAHRGAPDKTPERRLATLHAAGKLAIPFTTGILVGIGESREDRIQALEAIAASHAEFGHVQEVIVQNFVPKPGTLMRDHPACSVEDLVDAIGLARAILPSEVAVQAPPNLVDDPGILIDAGVDDFGGISPVTVDHVNPERPWPELDALRAVVEARGLALVPRLTIHPRYTLDPGRWLDPDLRFAVLDRSDAEGLARDDPGATFPERYEAAANVGTGAEVIQVGRRSTAWYSGADRLPPVIIPGPSLAGTAVAEVLAGVRAGQEPGVDELVTLFTARGPEVPAIAELADELRAQAAGDVVTFVRNRNINYTNVCTFRCAFCGFSKGPASLNLRGRPYLLSNDEIAARVVEAAATGATEVCLQGGIHPDFDGDYYNEVAHSVGLRSNVTIMFGHVEQPVHWAKHLVRTRDLQKRTGGFTEFVPLPFVHMASPIYLKRRARRGPTWREVVLMHAVGRVAYHGHIDNIQASWVKLGVTGAQQLLRAGVNDLGGTLMDESISRAAGAAHGQAITEAEFREVVEPLGRTLVERTTLYRHLGHTPDGLVAAGV